MHVRILGNSPSLYEIRGGFLNIFLSKGWLFIRFHLFIRICLSSGTEGRYSVTSGKICKFAKIFAFAMFLVVRSRWLRWLNLVWGFTFLFYSSVSGLLDVVVCIIVIGVLPGCNWFCDWLSFCLVCLLSFFFFAFPFYCCAPLCLVVLMLCFCRPLFGVAFAVALDSLSCCLSALMYLLVVYL